MRLPKHSQNILHFLQFYCCHFLYLIFLLIKHRKGAKNLEFRGKRVTSLVTSINRFLNPSLSHLTPVNTEVDVKLFIIFNRRLEKFHPNRFILVFRKKQTVGAEKEAPGKLLFSYS